MHVNRFDIPADFLLPEALVSFCVVVKVLVVIIVVDVGYTEIGWFSFSTFSGRMRCSSNPDRNKVVFETTGAWEYILYLIGIGYIPRSRPAQEASRASLPKMSLMKELDIGGVRLHLFS